MIDAGLDLKMISYLDTMSSEVRGVHPEVCAGNKFRFWAKTHKAAFSNQYYFYDSVGVARAHPKLPGIHRPYGLWMCGIEVWNHLPKYKQKSLAEAELPLAISRYTLNRYRSVSGELPQAQVCWLGTEDDNSPAREAKAPGAPKVLTIGRIDDAEQYSKGQRELIDCWPQVLNKVPDAQLVIVGGGSGLPGLKQHAQRSPVGRSINVTGFVEDEQISKYWSEADVFAMPSRGEGFGLVYVEAMRWGLPTIASTHDAGAEVNVDGETGFNVSLDEPNQLAERIITLLENASLRRDFGKNSERRWREQFSYSAFRRRFEPIITHFERTR